MKTKILISILALCVMLLNTFNCISSPVQDDSDKQILSMLKSFYSNYITENSKMPPNQKNIKLIKNKYCTSTFLKKIDKQELEYDPFLNAQDCKIEWLKTLTIRKDSIRNNLYYVSYINNYNNQHIIIKVIVVKLNQLYKIDLVW